MDSLPPELVDAIIGHIADSLEHSPWTTKTTLGQIRLTCRELSAPASKYFWSHLHITMSSCSADFQRLLLLSQIPRVASQVRKLTLLVADPYKRLCCLHPRRRPIANIAATDATDIEAAPSSPSQHSKHPSAACCDCQGVSAEGVAALAKWSEWAPYKHSNHNYPTEAYAFRDTLDNFVALRSLVVHTASTHPASSLDNRSAVLKPDSARKDFIGWLVHHLLVGYHLSHSSSVQDIIIHDFGEAHSELIEDIDLDMFHRDLDLMYNGHRKEALKRVHFQVSDLRKPFRPDTTRPWELHAIDWLLGHSPDTPSQLERLAVVRSAEGTPSISHQALGSYIPLSKQRFTKSIYPALQALHLNGFRISRHHLTEFLSTRTPALRRLVLGDNILYEGDWWECFDDLRSSCHLESFMFLGPNAADQTTVKWRMSSTEHDPRPLALGDSIKHLDLERYVTGKSDENPGDGIDPNMERVYVWDAPEKPAV